MRVEMQVKRDSISVRDWALVMESQCDDLQTALGADIATIQAAKHIRGVLQTLVEEWDAYYPRCVVCDGVGPQQTRYAVEVCSCETVQVSHHGVIQVEMRG